MGIRRPAFRWKWGSQRALLVSAVSQVPSAQNNRYAKMAYLGAAYSEALHMPHLGTKKEPSASVQKK